MSQTVTIEIPAASEALVRQPLALHEELRTLAPSAAHGTVLDAGEAAVVPGVRTDQEPPDRRGRPTHRGGPHLRLRAGQREPRAVVPPVRDQRRRSEPRAGGTGSAAAGSRGLTPPAPYSAWTGGSFRSAAAVWRPTCPSPGVASTCELDLEERGRVLPGCPETLDIYHAGERLSGWTQKIFGEGTAGATAALERGRELLLTDGWSGVCAWVAELSAAGDAAERSRRQEATERLLGHFAKHTKRLNYRGRLASGRPRAGP